MAVPSRRQAPSALQGVGVTFTFPVVASSGRLREEVEGVRDAANQLPADED